MAWDAAKRAKAVAALKRNAKLRREGKLPPLKRQVESIPLDSPLFNKPVKGKKKTGKVSKPAKGDPGNRELVLRLLALIERLV